jgi:hypothetical protein
VFAITLKVDFFLYALFPKNMMAAANTLLKTQPQQEFADVFKFNASVCISS